MLSFTMLGGNTVIIKRLVEDDCTEHYNIIKWIEKSNTKGLSIFIILLLRYAVHSTINKYLLVIYITGILGGHSGHGIVISSLERKYWQVQS